MRKRAAPTVDLREVALVLGKKILIVACAHLGGEEVVFASDGYPLLLDRHGWHEGRVVYRISELRRLAASAPCPDALRQIHEAKKWLGGYYRGME